MLKSMRKHAKYFYILFVIIILSFVFWGVGSGPDETQRLYVATVGNMKISTEDFWRAYQRTFDIYREVYKEQLDEKMLEQLRLKDMVLDELVEDRVLTVAAYEMGITVSDLELEESIVKNPVFQRDGIFSREIYLNVLRNNRLAVALYEDSKRRELAVLKLRALIAGGVELMPGELAGIEGEKDLVESLTAGILKDKRERAIKAFVQGLKTRMRVTVNRELIS